MIGRSMISPDGLAIRPRMPASCLHLLAVAARAGIHHQEDGVQLLAALVVLERPEHDVRDLVAGVGPDVDDLVVAFAVGDDALAILLLDLVDLLVAFSSSGLSPSGMIMSAMPMEMPALVASRKPSSLSRSSVIDRSLAARRPCSSAR